MNTRTAARDRRTVTLALPTGAATGTVTMDQPGGIITRPAVRHFDPTFWPVSTWLTIDGAVDGEAPAAALAVEMTRAIAARPDGTAEVIVARNATKERAWRIVPILACPAKGHEPGETTATVALWWPLAGAPADLTSNALRRQGARSHRTRGHGIRPRVRGVGRPRRGDHLGPPRAGRMGGNLMSRGGSG